MSARVLSQFVVLVLVFLGVVAVGARYNARQQSQLALADSLWRLTYKIDFEAAPKLTDQEAAASITLGRPYPTSAVEILPETITESDPSLQSSSKEHSVSGNREYVISTRHKGKYNVIAEFDLRLHASDSWNGRSQLESLTAVQRRNYTTGDRDHFPTTNSHTGQVLQRAPGSEATDSERLEWFYQFCLNELEQPPPEDQDAAVDYAIATKKASPLVRTKIFVTLCRAAGIPARLVSGFELRQNENAQPHVWAEVHRDNHWIPFDPVNGFARVMPVEFVPIRRGGTQLITTGSGVIRAKDAKILSTNYAILRLPAEEAVLKAAMRRPAQIFDLTRLPLKLHDTLSLMLLLPLGALITAVLRNIIGIRTLGTFAPALLAMSFIYAAWGTGLVILTVVIIVGLVGRSMLEKLHLLMVPRLSIVLTTIILCVVFAVSLLHYFVPEESAQTVLIPLVILTILIERFFVTSEEDSTSFAIKLVLGTLVVAAFCYLLLRWDDVGQLVLIYPEIHLFTIAAFILIGRYSGYRLTELWRFRDLVKGDSDTSPPSDALTTTEKNT